MMWLNVCVINTAKVAAGRRQQISSIEANALAATGDLHFLGRSNQSQTQVNLVKSETIKPGPPL